MLSEEALTQENITDTTFKAGGLIEGVVAVRILYRMACSRRGGGMYSTAIR